MIRVCGDALASKNIIPVDWTAQAILTIAESENGNGQIYHLTNPAPITHGALHKWAESYLKQFSVELQFVSRLGKDATRLELAIDRVLRPYRSYLFGEPTFDRTKTDRVLAERLPYHVNRSCGMQCQRLRVP